jgi:hypothetical protein
MWIPPLGAQAPPRAAIPISTPAPDPLLMVSRGASLVGLGAKADYASRVLLFRGKRNRRTLGARRGAAAT